MVLEATMIMLDTSEFMRDGDYFPTRLIASQEAASAVFRSKTRDNPENSVGLMTLGGCVKVSFVRDSQKFQAASRDTAVDPSTRSFAAAIQVAVLALRHRQNENQRQRIVAFVGSPLSDTEAELSKLASRLRKNSVSVDVVLLGQDPSNALKLSKFVSETGSEDKCHFLNVPPSSTELEDVVSSSAICSNGPVFGGDDLGFEDDPELAMALRMSLEEEQQRQARATAT